MNPEHATKVRNTMKNQMLKTAMLGAVLALGVTMTSTCLAGRAMKWADVPKAVRTTILANGGVAGQSVDLENGKINGLAIYEASIKDKDGTIGDLVITEDGKLVD